MKSQSVIEQKSMAFALRIIKAFQFLQEQKGEYVISKQLLRSGTAIGASVREAEFAESKKDFIHKLHISLKEANETDYWLTLLYQSDYLNDVTFKSIQSDCAEIIKLLVSIIKSSKSTPDTSAVFNY